MTDYIGNAGNKSIVYDIHIVRGHEEQLRRSKCPFCLTLPTAEARSFTAHLDKIGYPAAVLH